MNDAVTLVSLWQLENRFGFSLHSSADIVLLVGNTFPTFRLGSVCPHGFPFGYVIRCKLLKITVILSALTARLRPQAITLSKVSCGTSKGRIFFITPPSLQK